MCPVMTVTCRTDSDSVCRNRNSNLPSGFPLSVSPMIHQGAWSASFCGTTTRACMFAWIQAGGYQAKHLRSSLLNPLTLLTLTLSPAGSHAAYHPFSNVPRPLLVSFPGPPSGPPVPCAVRSPLCLSRARPDDNPACSALGSALPCARGGMGIGTELISGEPG